MKELEATRRNKDALVAHFIAGGTELDIPAPLNRLHPSVVRECKEFFERKQRSKNSDTYRIQIPHA